LDKNCERVILLWKNMLCVSEYFMLY